MTLRTSPPPARATAAAAPPRRGSFAGTGRLIRLAVRRDRIVLPVWIAALIAVPAATASSILALYDSEAERLAYARSWAGSVVTQVFNGPAAGPQAGAIVIAESFLLLATLPPLMSIFAVVRHTRQNEEAGRAELLGSAVVGRFATLTAAVAVMIAADLLVGAGTAAALVLAGLPASGSVLAGAVVAATGAAFGCVAAVTAQVFTGSRGAGGAASAVLALAFGVRAMGDATGDIGADGVTSTAGRLSWLSPIGWSSQVFPFTRSDVGPLTLLVAFAVGCLVLAAVLGTRRDVGAGLVADRRGRPAASRWLRSALGLAWRLHRGALAGWLSASALLGVGMGAVAEEVDDLFSGNPDAAELIAALGGTDRLVDAYLSVVMGFFAFLAAGYGVQATLRLRTEEAAGTLEGVLAAAVGRSRWAAGHLACIVGGVLALLAVGGLSSGITYGVVSGDVGGQVPRLLEAASVQVPAVLVLTAAVFLVFAVAPRATAAAGWSLLVACLTLYQLGELLDLPQAVLNVSPFTHTPLVPAAAAEAAPLLALSLIALAVCGTALALFRRRDVPA